MTDPSSRDSAPDDESTLNPFGAVPRASWRKAVDAGLRGRSFESLSSPDADSLVREVLYTLEDAPAAQPGPGVFPFGRGAKAPRARISQRTTFGPECAAQLRAQFELGAEVAWVEAGARPVEPADCFAGSGFAAAHLVVDADHPPKAAWPADLAGGVVKDLLAPIYARRTTTIDPQWLSALSQRSLLVDLRPVHEAGASPSEVLAAALGAGVAVLRAAEAQGQDLAEVAEALIFAFSTELHFFDSLATIRSGRSLWAQVLAASGVAPELADMCVRMDSGLRDLSRLDPWINVLRGSTSCFAAQLAGATYVGVAPFDTGSSREALGRRLAVNTQVVLREESHAAAVADPAGGSHFIEARTTQLRAAAWERFVVDEGAGGWVARLGAGEIATRVRAQFGALQKSLETGRSVRVGVSRFPSAWDAGAVAAAAPNYPQLGPQRLATGFERLRATASEKSPQLLLVALGPLRDHKARADFARDFLAAGGIELVESEADLTDPTILGAELAKVAGAVVAGSDEAYQEHVDRFTTLRAHEGAYVAVVARPSGAGEVLGPLVDAHLHMRANAIELCEGIHAHAANGGAR